MQTYLPELPFPVHADVEVTPGFHSATKTSPRQYPRTDLDNLIPWTSFLDDIHDVVQSATSRAKLSSEPFNLNGLTMTTSVVSEEGIRALAMYALHEPVQQIVSKLGFNGYFINSGGGNVTMIGLPDLSWITGSEQPHPKLVVEYKSWWVADLVDLPAAHASLHHTLLSRQSLDALQQIYGYMTFNENKFGVLTNWKRTWFLRRAETPERTTLEYFLLELDAPATPISILKAWVGMVLLAESNWFSALPTISTIPSEQHFRTPNTALREWTLAIETATNYSALPVDGRYPCLPLDFRLCRFEKSSIRIGAQGCVVIAHLLPIQGRDLDVICKVIDVLQYPAAGESLEVEATAYARFQTLQGRAIPTVYGFYEVWGILRLLALSNVGKAIPESENIKPKTRRKMKAALQLLHDQGYIHGDIARRNFCRAQNGNVVLIDLETCRRLEGSESENRAEYEREMDLVNDL